MARFAYWCVLAALAAGTMASSGGALADDADDLKSLLADCSQADLSTYDMRDCLGRAQTLDETDPSPQLQALMAKLERETEAADDAQNAHAPTSAAQAETHAQLH